MNISCKTLCMNVHISSVDKHQDRISWIRCMAWSEQYCAVLQKEETILGMHNIRVTVRITGLSASSNWDRSIFYLSLYKIRRKKGKPVGFHSSRKYVEKLPSQDLKITFEGKSNQLYHDSGGENTDIHKLPH